MLNVAHAVVELTDAATGNLVCCYRAKGAAFRAPVFKAGRYTLTAGKASRFPVEEMTPHLAGSRP